jgi:hypothetical protein
MDFVQSVLEFNRIGGNANEFNARNVAKYIGFLLEEARETIEALPYDTKFVELAEVLHEYEADFKQGRYDEQCEKIDRVEALDGAIDCAVIGLGLGNALGADVWNAALEVADSNMSKFVEKEDGEVVALRDANGKIMKGPNYFRPKLAKFFPA